MVKRIFEFTKTWFLSCFNIFLINYVRSLHEIKLRKNAQKKYIVMSWKNWQNWQNIYKDMNNIIIGHVLSFDIQRKVFFSTILKQNIGFQESTCWCSTFIIPSISLEVLGVGDLDDGVVAHDNQKAIVFLETDIIGVCKDTKTKSNHFELDKVLSN